MNNVYESHIQVFSDISLVLEYTNGGRTCKSPPRCISNKEDEEDKDLVEDYKDGAKAANNQDNQDNRSCQLYDEYSLLYSLVIC